MPAGAVMPLRACSTCGRGFRPRHARQVACEAHELRGREHRSPTTRAQDAEYRAERERILAGDPPCHWCGAPHADTADHVVPVSAGGGHRGNLVPACADCNLRRQANPEWVPPRKLPPEKGAPGRAPAAEQDPAGPAAMSSGPMGRADERSGSSGSLPGGVGESRAPGRGSGAAGGSRREKPSGRPRDDRGHPGALRLG